MHRHFAATQGISTQARWEFGNLFAVNAIFAPTFRCSEPVNDKVWRITTCRNYLVPQIRCPGFGVQLKCARIAKRFKIRPHFATISVNIFIEREAK